MKWMQIERWTLQKAERDLFNFCHPGMKRGLWIEAGNKTKTGKLTSVPCAMASCKAAELSGCSLLCVLAMALNGDVGGTWSFFSLLPSGRARSPPAQDTAS